MQTILFLDCIEERCRSNEGRREDMIGEAKKNHVLFVRQGRSTRMYDKSIEKMCGIDPRGKFHYTRMEGCDGLQWIGSCGGHG